MRSSIVRAIVVNALSCSAPLSHYLWLSYQVAFTSIAAAPIIGYNEVPG